MHGEQQEYRILEVKDAKLETISDSTRNILRNNSGFCKNGNCKDFYLDTDTKGKGFIWYRDTEILWEQYGWS